MDRLCLGYSFSLVHFVRVCLLGWGQGGGWGRGGWRVLHGGGNCCEVGGVKGNILDLLHSSAVLAAIISKFY